VDGRIHASIGALASCERGLDDAEQVGARLEASRTVQPRELGVGQEAGQDALEAVDLRLGGEQGQPPAALLGGLDDELDVRPHGAEGVAKHRPVRSSV
jgi:hypothetical protein